MSWDVWLFVPPDGVEDANGVSADYEFPTLDPDQVVRAATSTFGAARISTPGWLEIDGPQIRAGLALPTRDGTPYERGSVMLHVRGGGHQLIAQILELAEKLGCGALDLQTGDWLTPAGGSETFHGWRSYRDRVTGETPD